MCGRRVGVAGVVEKPAECKLVEAVIVPVVVVQVVGGRRVVVTELLGVDGVEVGGVRVEQDARLVRCLLKLYKLN